MSELGSDLTLAEAGLDRLEKIAESGGIVGRHWILEMILEIRRLRAENERLKKRLGVREQESIDWHERHGWGEFG